MTLLTQLSLATDLLGQSTQAATQETLRDLPSYGAQLVRMLLSLGLLLVLLVVALKLVQRRGARGTLADSGDALEVLASRRLDAATRLLLVRAGAEHVLIAVGGGRAVRLASGPSLDPDAAAETSDGHRVGGPGPGFELTDPDLRQAAARWRRAANDEENR
jgi:flagellar biogenesis protein FliO